MANAKGGRDLGASVWDARRQMWVEQDSETIAEHMTESGCNASARSESIDIQAQAEPALQVATPALSGAAEPSQVDLDSTSGPSIPRMADDTSQAMGEGPCAAGGGAFEVDDARFDQPHCSDQRVSEEQAVEEGPRLETL